VTSIHFALNCEWMLSIGRDKMFQYNCSETGRRLGTFQSEAWCTALQYPFLKTSWAELKCDMPADSPKDFSFDRQVKDFGMCERHIITGKRK
jgi:hypothetical protein